MTSVRGQVDPTSTTHRFAPRGAALDLFHCRDGEVLMSGPAGTGKSRAALEKVHLLMLVNPGAKALLVRKTGESLTSSTLATWREHVVAEAQAAGVVTYYGGSREEPAQYRYENGSKVMLGGMDRPTKVMSTEYDVIFVDEAIELTLTDWEALTARLRHGRIGFQQLIGCTNPSTASHWLKQRADAGATTLLESRHRDNARYYGPDGELTTEGADYLARLDSLTGVRRLRLRDGKWVAAEGIIYEEWDDAVHLVDPYPVPAEWPRYWTIDFGHTNPFVLQWWAQDPDGRFVLYRELYRTGLLVEDAARIALAQVAPGGVWAEPQPTAVIVDHDAEDRATWTRHSGLPTRAAKKDVLVGIDAVTARLRPAGDGRPRLTVMRGCVIDRDESLVQAAKPTCLAEELPGYVWQPTPDGKPAKDAPLKVDDHACDAMRYLVATVDLTARPRVRRLQ